MNKLFPINSILDKLDRIVLGLIETAWPQFPSALIVSRYAVSAQWLTGPLPVCLCVWNERPLPICLRAARSVLSLHPHPKSVCLFACLSVWWQSDPSVLVSVSVSWKVTAGLLLLNVFSLLC